MNREDFRKLAETRLEDAKALLEAGRFDAAYYLAGYAVECALKACISRHTREFDFPPRSVSEYYTHDLSRLLGTSKLKNELEASFKTDEALAEYWNVVKDWKEDSRYDSEPDAEARARDLIEAISEAEHGVLQCLSRY
ncbi:MAG TPA: HEPN domain-containing protein, partial [Bryobacteraceae bacterium]|nr:HEPN domain-containing protein [Bryobacteraceae bacterium]